jgi:PIN domain nuclease of toxin-antitoxin system
MNLLLDTQAFLWWADTPRRLSQTALAALRDPADQLILSVVSAWEVQIKLHTGKLNITSSLDHLIETQQKTNGLRVLPVYLEHVGHLAHLPAIHKDPFDRLLIAQALAEELILVSSDALLSQYPVRFLW